MKSYGFHRKYPDRVVNRPPRKIPQHLARTTWVTWLSCFSICVFIFNAHSHLGAPSLAPLKGPVGSGTVVDSEFEISWSDYDFPIATGTATVDLFFTRNNPPPYYRGQLPDGLEGSPVVLGIPEKDSTNLHVWNTSTVAAGTYWIWSRVNEPPGEMNSGLSFIEFSPGVVTVAHPGDQVPPAIVFTRPNTPVAIATEDYRIEYSVFDPDMSSHILIEAAPHDTEDFILVYEGAATSSIGTVLWNTSQLSNGDWKLRAKIEDQRGLSFSGYSRYFVTVSHLLASDAGVDAGIISETIDSGLPPLVELDSGVRQSRPIDDTANCSCHNQRHADPEPKWILFMLLFCWFSWRYSKAA
jgi:hypothetical protein